MTAQSYGKTMSYAAGIGGGESGTGKNIAITGGHLSVDAGSFTIGSGDNAVYGVKVADGYKVVSNREADKAKYPVRVGDGSEEPELDTPDLDFTVSGGTYGTAAGNGDYHIEADDSGTGGTLIIHPQSADAAITVTMKEAIQHVSDADKKVTTDRSVVDPGAGKTVNVTIDAVSIDLSGNGAIDAAAFTHASGTLNLTLAQDSANTLISGANHAGLEKNDHVGGPDAVFAPTIKSEGAGENQGSLVAESRSDAADTNAAGIGGGYSTQENTGHGASYITIAAAGLLAIGGAIRDGNAPEHRNVPVPVRRGA